MIPFTTPMKIVWESKDIPADPDDATTVSAKENLSIDVMGHVTYGPPPGALTFVEGPINVDVCRVIVNEYALANVPLDAMGQNEPAQVIFYSKVRPNQIEIWTIVGFGKPSRLQQRLPLIELRCDNVRRRAAILTVLARQTLVISGRRLTLSGRRIRI